MPEINIYKAGGGFELEVNFEGETIWLTQQQMADLFGTKRQAITRHLSNIFKSKELEQNSVSSILELTAADGKRYKNKVYNLDAIISVGYRVNSRRATEFRIWATSVLNQYIQNGCVLNEKRLVQRDRIELVQAMELLQGVLTHNDHITDVGKEAFDLIIRYSKSWDLLLAYDEDRLELPSKSSKKIYPLSYDSVTQLVSDMKKELAAKGQASDLFGRERDQSLEAILGNVEQTFGGQHVYQTIEERAANLLYLVIKNHPFVDGNKRLGSLIFLMYIRLHRLNVDINQNGLVALALLVAGSDPSQKDLMIRLIVNLLTG